MSETSSSRPDAEGPSPAHDSDAVGDGRAAFQALWTATGTLVRHFPVLQAFAPFPATLTWAGRAHKSLPSTPHFLSGQGQTTPETATFLSVARAVTPFAEWRQTYGEEQVGHDFLNRYGYFEYAGPRGHFHCTDLRFYVGFWGAGLHYDWHWHAAAEIYFVLAGSALFQVEGRPPRKLGPGEACTHEPYQTHALTAGENGLTVFAIWKGEGLEQDAHMPDRDGRQI